MKRFLEWIGLKEKLHGIVDYPPLVSERDLWWVSIGENIGSEINGNSSLFSRPALIVKKLTNDFYLIAPTTTQRHEGSWFVPVSFGTITEYICLNHIRTIDYRRLSSKLGQIGSRDFAKVKEGFLRLYI
jgi:mRNA interferase MazF